MGLTCWTEGTDDEAVGKNVPGNCEHAGRGGLGGVESCRARQMAGAPYRRHGRTSCVS